MEKYKGKKVETKIKGKKKMKENKKKSLKVINYFNKLF